MPISSLWSHYWEVLTVFLIPFGGGIPSGTLLAKKYAIDWRVTTFLYFISDLILACVFELILIRTQAASVRSPKLSRFGTAFKQSLQKTTLSYGKDPGPLTLIYISFAVDPMTGRAAGQAVGHGFLAGWLFAIIGDLFYFGILMASTLWLNGILGDGTWMTIITIAIMMLVPWAIRKIKAPA